MVWLNKIYFYLYILILIFLALPMFKVGSIRIEQMLLLLTFGVLTIDEINSKEFDFWTIFFFVMGALVLVLISLSTTYAKTDEYKYYIKFLFIYPTTFYVGYRIRYKLSLKSFLNTLDFSLLFFVISWFIVMYIPLPMSILSKVVHLRDFGNGALEFLPYQGTFFEAGAMGIIVGCILLISILAHYEFDKHYKEKKYLFGLYFFTIYMLFMSKNKTVWLSYVLILMFLVFYKIYLYLKYTNYYTPKSKIEENEILNKFLKINNLYLILGGALMVGLFFLYNTYSPEPFITMQEFQYKMKYERGAQFKIAWDLIEASNFFGGYGWGFVDPYFKNMHIMGVGDNAGSINSVFLDAWLQGSIFAVIYLAGILYICFSNKYFLTIAIPMYLLFFGLTNPIVAEEYFLFLGFSYSFIKYKSHHEK